MMHDLLVWILPTKVDRRMRLAGDILDALDEAFRGSILDPIHVDSTLSVSESKMTSKQDTDDPPCQLELKPFGDSLWIVDSECDYRDHHTIYPEVRPCGAL